MAKIAKKQNNAKTAAKSAPQSAPVVKQPKTAKTEKVAELVKKRLTIRSDFNVLQGSVLGNRRLNFCSFMAGSQTTPDADLIAITEKAAYNPRQLGGKRHNSKNVASFDKDRANAIAGALLARPDVVNTRITYASGMYSVWFAFASENPSGEKA